jgi:hypothetical protein
VPAIPPHQAQKPERKDAEYTLPWHFPSSTPSGEPKTQRTSQLLEFEGEKRTVVHSSASAEIRARQKKAQKQSRPLFRVRQEPRRCGETRERERAMSATEVHTAQVTGYGCLFCNWYLPTELILRPILVDGCWVGIDWCGRGLLHSEAPPGRGPLHRQFFPLSSGSFLYGRLSLSLYRCHSFFIVVTLFSVDPLSLPSLFLYHRPQTTVVSSQQQHIGSGDSWLSARGL